jgi:hypothetical protein
MLKKILNPIIISIIILITIIVIIYFDLENIITKLGLSPTLWSSVIVSIFPILLTIILWSKEKKERKEQIEKDVKLQKNLIIRTAYIDYFESFLEQTNEFIIFLQSYIINEKNIFGEKEKEEIKVKSLLTAIILEEEEKVWKLNYRKYAFKSIGIDIFNYNYKGKNINIRAYMPYFGVVNELNKISERKALRIIPSGGYIEELKEEDLVDIAKRIIKNKKVAEELLEFLETFKSDVEERVNFNSNLNI